MPKNRINKKLIVYLSSSIYVMFTILVLVILPGLQLSEISVMIYKFKQANNSWTNFCHVQTEKDLRKFHFYQQSRCCLDDEDMLYVAQESTLIVYYEVQISNHPC
jgi:hypothetical protein